MTIKQINGRGRAALPAILLIVAGACTQSVRVPLAVPLPAVGGARPVAPQGIQLIAEFGDGVWGQEQERAEMRGVGIGFSVGDRGEMTWDEYNSTRAVTDSVGGHHTGSLTRSVRGKVRLWDSPSGQVAVGVHVARLKARRTTGSVQDEELRAWDIAVPVEFYHFSGDSLPSRFRIYAAPRVVLQSFQDRQTQASTNGTMFGGLGGISGRWRFVAVAGELNLLHRPAMESPGVTSTSGWIVLPMGSLRLVLPIGE